MCHASRAADSANCATYRCPNGCVHLVWNNVTLHLRPDEWDLLARTVAQTDQAVHEDRARAAFDDFSTM